MTNGSENLSGSHSCKTFAYCHCGTLCFTERSLSCCTSLWCNCPYKCRQTQHWHDSAIQVMPVSASLPRGGFDPQLSRMKTLRCNVNQLLTVETVFDYTRRTEDCIPQCCQVAWIQVPFMRAAKCLCWLCQCSEFSHQQYCPQKMFWPLLSVSAGTMTLDVWQPTAFPYGLHCQLHFPPLHCVSGEKLSDF